MDLEERLPVYMLDEFGDWQEVPQPVTLGHDDDESHIVRSTN